MADRLKEVIQIAIETLGESQASKLVATLRQIGDAGTLADDQLASLLDGVEAISREAANTRDLQELIRQYQSLTATQGELTDAVDRAGLHLRLATEQESSLAVALRQKNAALVQAKAAQQSYADQSERTAEGQQRVREAVKAATAEQKAADREWRLANAALGTATKNYERAADAQEKMQRQATPLADAIKKAGLSTTDLANAQKTLADRATAADRELEKLTRATEDAARAAEKLAAAKPIDERSSERIAKTTSELHQYASTSEAAERSTGRLGAAVGTLRGVLASLGVVLGLRAALDGVKGLLSLGDAAERTKIQLTQLYGSASAGNAAFDRLRLLARENGQEFDTVLDAAKRLKAVGLDPLDGTLQALIDQSAALGGAQETLTGVGLALGQMWSKQKIQTEEILQLVERGVPAFDLLAKVTGKQGAELTKLIESGKLGRKEIKGLIDEIGRSTEGAAAANLGTISGLVTSLKDRFKEFLETIANSGVVDYFKQQLTGLRDTITRMADDGSLVTWAKNVGAGLVTVGQSVGTFFSGVSVVYNAFKTSVHAAATAIAASLGTVVKAIAFIKELDFKDKMVSDMAGVQSSAQRLHEIADSLYAAAADNYDQTGEAAHNLAQAFKDLANSGAQVGSEFDKAGPAVSRQASDLRLTGEAAERAKAQFAQLPLSVQKLIGPLIESTGALTGLNKVTNDSAAAFRDQQQAIINARKDVEAAKLAIVELAKSGETSGEAFERANAALIAAERHLANVTAEATRGQAATEGLADAFKTLGIKSQAELQKLADTQRAALETVTAAHRQGEATIEDVQRAFEAYAATARAAAKDSSEALQQQVEAQLQAEATALGLAEKLKQAGEAGKAAGQEVGRAFADATDSISDAGDAADELKDKTAETANEMTNVGDSAQATSVQVNSAINTILVLTDAQQRALRDINEQFYRGQIDGVEYGRRVREAMEGVTESLEDQAEAARRAVDELRELNQQMQDDADRADGNEAAVERRRHQEQLDRIAELEREGGYAARREAAEARRLAEDEHKRRLAEIREQARAERDARREASSDRTDQDRSAATERLPAATALVHELRITVNGQGVGSLDPSDPQTARAITEAVNRVLQQAMSTSGRGGSLLR